MDSRPNPPSRHGWRTILALAGLYFVQGMPFGFQVSALPVYLRESGVSLTAIGFAGALSLPWMLKALWAPWVDRYSIARLGRRRSWILPMQVALALTCAAASWTEPQNALYPLLGLVFCMNLFAATMDIAVDGLAVDLLSKEQLGYGNIAQVVGYKLGMLTSGGLLMWASESIGWRGMFAAMAALTLVGLAAMLLLRESRATIDAAPESVKGVIAAIWATLWQPGTGWLLLAVATYKLGESMSDTLFRPFLIDVGFTRGEIGLWVGTYGMVASLSGSVVGGVLASRSGLLRAVAVTAALRAVPIVGQIWLSLLAAPTPAAVVAVTVAESFFGGALTTAMFAYMMSRINRDVGATHFTFLATVEVLGKSVSSWTAGLWADAVGGRDGYTVVFTAALVLSVLYLLVLVPLSRSAHSTRSGPSGAMGHGDK